MYLKRFGTAFLLKILLKKGDKIMAQKVVQLVESGLRTRWQSISIYRRVTSKKCLLQNLQFTIRDLAVGISFGLVQIILKDDYQNHFKFTITGD